MRMAGRRTMRMHRIKKIVRISRELISSLLFPKRCPVCDELLSPEESDKGIHPACENKLFPVKGAVCMHCGRPLGQLHSQMRQKDNEVQNKDKKEDKSFEFNQRIPSYMTMESTYEYCRECVRKGYVSEFPYANRRKGQKCNKFSAQLPYTHSFSNITQAKSLYLYRGAIKTTMYRFKYANKREYAAFFARKAVQEYSAWLG